MVFDARVQVPHQSAHGDQASGKHSTSPPPPRGPPRLATPAQPWRGGRSRWSRALLFARRFWRKCTRTRHSVMQGGPGAGAWWRAHARGHVGPCQVRARCVPLGGVESSRFYAHVAQRRARFASIRSRRAKERWRARSSGTLAPLPKYISSGVWPWNAECGMVELCCTT